MTASAALILTASAALLVASMALLVASAALILTVSAALLAASAALLAASAAPYPGGLGGFPDGIGGPLPGVLDGFPDGIGGPPGGLGGATAHGNRPFPQASARIMPASLEGVKSVPAARTRVALSLAPNTGTPFSVADSSDICYSIESTLRLAQASRTSHRAVDRRSTPSEDGLTHHLFLIALGFSASLGAGLATGVGALPAVFAARATNKMLDAALGFAGGVMLSVAAFGLILPAFHNGAVGIIVLGVLCGVILFGIADRLIPHLHFISGLEGPPSHLRRVWLLILAMTLHNLPEGLAVGVAFGREDIAAAVVIAIGVGIQNMPEGLTVALPLVREGYRPARAIGWATLTGLVEPMTALIGATLVLFIGPILPLGLAFAAGCMLYVTLDEVIPESHRRGHHLEATTGAVLGFVLMTALERLFS